MPGPDPIAQLRNAVNEAARAMAGNGGAEPPLERPPQPQHGGSSSNAAMLLAGRLGKSPREVAEQLGGELSQRLGERAERVEVAGPGFVNLFLSQRWYREAIAELVAAGEELGLRRVEHPERVLV